MKRSSTGYVPSLTPTQLAESLSSLPNVPKRYRIASVGLTEEPKTPHTLDFFKERKEEVHIVDIITGKFDRLDRNGKTVLCVRVRWVDSKVETVVAAASLKEDLNSNPPW